MKRAYTVDEISEQLNKSKSTIYTYLQNGKLTGEKIDGKWIINNDSLLIRENVKIKDCDNLIDEIKTIENTEIEKINENIYIEYLKSKLEKCNVVLEDIADHVQSELNLNNEIANLLKKPEIEKTSNLIDEILLKNENYQLLKNMKLQLEKKLTSMSDKYKEIENIFQSIDIIKIQYSKSTESTYVKLKIKNLIDLLNRLSKMNKKFIIINENLFNKDIVTIRFSNHLPNYLKGGIIKSNSKIADIVVPYKDKDSEKNFELISNEYFHQIEKIKKENIKIEEEMNQNIEAEYTKIKKNIKQISLKNKVDVAKEYSTKTIKTLTKTQLKEFYVLCEDLLENEKVKKEGFVKNLEDKQIAIRKALKKVS